jgi:hypothetical protein
MDNAGHLLHLENAEEVAPLYAGFLRSILTLAVPPGG